jgi:hypothetical protein
LTGLLIEDRTVEDLIFGIYELFSDPPEDRRRVRFVWRRCVHNAVLQLESVDALDQCSENLRWWRSGKAPKPESSDDALVEFLEWQWIGPREGSPHGTDDGWGPVPNDEHVAERKTVLPNR